MTSRERIYKILNFEIPDRVGIHDIFLNDTIKNWRDDSLPGDISIEEYFELDFEFIDLKEYLSIHSLTPRANERFAILSFQEPFQKLCSIMGTQEVLRRIAFSPDKIQEELISQTDLILNLLDKVICKGITVDGVWVWGDMAYRDNLFFSPTFYKKILFSLHKRIFSFLDTYNLPVLFHSDGNISDLIPLLLKAGIRAIHPLEEESRVDIDKLIKLYKNDLVFIGHMDIRKIFYKKDKLEVLKKKIEYFKKNCFYIYHADYPVSPDISLADYRNLLWIIKRYGRY